MMDLAYRVRELSRTIDDLKTEVSDLKDQLVQNEMWDNNDIIRNWKISLRTLASWRKEGLIEYVQIGNKILYPKEYRDSFIKNYSRRLKINQVLATNLN
jgi:hypothetical protein